jgi:hypothetical protein
VVREHREERVQGTGLASCVMKENPRWFMSKGESYSHTNK